MYVSTQKTRIECRLCRGVGRLKELWKGSARKCVFESSELQVLRLRIVSDDCYVGRVNVIFG